MAVDSTEYGKNYMEVLGQEINDMKMTKISEARAKQILDTIVANETAPKLAKIETLKKVTPIDRSEYVKSLEKIETLQEDILDVRNDLYARYFDAPDLQHLDHNQFRLWNAISDYATHTDLHKKTKGYQQKLFLSVVNDNNIGKAKLIDLGYKLAKAA